MLPQLSFCFMLVVQAPDSSTIGYLQEGSRRVNICFVCTMPAQLSSASQDMLLNRTTQCRQALQATACAKHESTTAGMAD